MKAITTTILLLVLCGCASPPKKQIALATNAWIRGVTKADVFFARHAVATHSVDEDVGPIISIGAGPCAGGDEMVVYTSLSYYKFTRFRGGGWRFVRSGSYNAD